MQKWPNALSERVPNVVGKKLVKAGGEDEMQERVGKKARRAILAGEGEGRGERGTYQPYERGTKKQRIMVTAPPPAALHGRKEPLGPKNDSRYQESAKNKGRGKADRNPTKTLSPQQKRKGKEQQGEGKGKGLYKKGSKGADLKKEVIKTPAGGTEKEEKTAKEESKTFFIKVTEQQLRNILGKKEEAGNDKQGEQQKQWKRKEEPQDSKGGHFITQKKQQPANPKMYKKYAKQDEEMSLSYDQDNEDSPMFVVTKPETGKPGNLGGLGGKAKKEKRFHLDLLGR